MIDVKATKCHDDATLPTYATDGSAGLDLYSVTVGTVFPGRRKVIETGIKLEIPPGYEAQVRPRSGLAFNHGVTVLNAPGTIDSDYRGEIKVVLFNHGEYPIPVEVGTRVAQIVIAPVTRARLVEDDDLSETDRGEGGFGSTGF